MNNHEQSTKSHEHEQNLPRHIQFADGKSAFAFVQPDGETLGWNDHKYISNPAERHMPGAAIVATESGNQYVLGHGMIIDSRRNLAYIIPEGADDQVPPLTFGEPWEIPGVLKTTAVRAVLAEDAKGRYGGELQSAEGESPFVAAHALLITKISNAIESGKMPEAMQDVIDQLR